MRKHSVAEKAKTKPATIREALESLQPLVDELRAAAGALANMDRHAAACPAGGRWRGVQEALEPLVEAQDKIIEEALGGPPAVGGNINIILDALRVVAWRIGANLSTDLIPAKSGPRWAQDEKLYDARQITSSVLPSYIYDLNLGDDYEFDVAGNLIRLDGKPYRVPWTTED